MDDIKTVVLIDDSGNTSFFNTVEEAKSEAETLTGPSFAIYTLYLRGEVTVAWKLQADTGTNLREVKKQTASPRSGTEWTTLEEKALWDAIRSGKQTMSQVAKQLGRSYSACYRKMQNLEEREQAKIEKSGTG